MTTTPPQGAPPPGSPPAIRPDPPQPPRPAPGPTAAAPGPPAVAPGQPAPGPAARAAAAVDAVAAVVGHLGRPELVGHLASLRRRLAHASCTVLVVGEFKKGKSTLINALVNAPVCPVDDDVATARPIELRHAAEPQAELVYLPEPGDDDDVEPRRRGIPIEQLAAYATEAGGAPDADRVERVVIGLPRNLLAGGLVLVDTPGVGGLGSPHSAATVAALPSADAVLFVTDASQELTASEIEFLRTARGMCPTVVFVMTKTDFYPAWRTILDLNRAHLERQGLAARTIATSAPLRAHAIARNDRDLNAESGYAELVAVLRDELAPAVELATASGVAAQLSEVLDLLESQLRSELAALDDPEDSARLVRELERTKEQAERLRGQAARWQHTLNDGIADLLADVDHDLRTRFRELVREAEEVLDGHDPAKVWVDFEPWMTRRATAEVVQNLAVLHQRSVQLCARVGQHFDSDHREIAARLELPAPTELTIAPAPQAAFKADARTVLSQTVSALRGTTGGFIMLSAFSNFAHMAFAGAQLVPSPYMLGGVGLLMGRKAFKDERQRALAQRRMQAKAAMRRYTDDVAIVAGKDTRDSVRRVNRQLRDHYLERAELLTSSTAESLAAAQQAVRAGEQRRAERRREVIALLERLTGARRSAAAVAAGPGRPAVTAAGSGA